MSDQPYQTFDDDPTGRKLTWGEFVAEVNRQITEQGFDDTRSICNITIDLFHPNAELGRLKVHCSTPDEDAGDCQLMIWFE